MTSNLEVIINNGGGITIQCDGYAHMYEGSTNEMIAEQAAEDILAALRGDDVGDWDGNEPECRIEYTDEDIRSGGYEVFNAADLREIISDPQMNEDTAPGGAAGSALWISLWRQSYDAEERES